MLAVGVQPSCAEVVQRRQCAQAVVRIASNCSLELPLATVGGIAQLSHDIVVQWARLEGRLTCAVNGS